MLYEGPSCLPSHQSNVVRFRRSGLNSCEGVLLQLSLFSVSTHSLADACGSLTQLTLWGVACGVG